MKNISRRKFLSLMGAGGSTLAGTSLLLSCKKNDSGDVDLSEEYKNQIEPPKDKMTLRENKKKHDRVSILGFGMMRLPNKDIEVSKEEEKVTESVIDQD